MFTKTQDKNFYEAVAHIYEQKKKDHFACKKALGRDSVLVSDAIADEARMRLAQLVRQYDDEYMDIMTDKSLDHRDALYKLEQKVLADMVQQHTVCMTDNFKKFFDYDVRRDPKTNFYCVKCGKDIKNKKFVYVHLIDGGVSILNPKNENSYTPDAGDCGLLPIGPGCAKEIGMEWVHKLKIMGDKKMSERKSYLNSKPVNEIPDEKI